METENIPHAKPVVKDIPLAPRIPPATVPPEVVSLENKFKTWNIRDNHKAHKALKEYVLKEIEADTFIPPHWKSALLTEISKRDGKALEVHVHASDSKEGFLLSVHIKPPLF